jgi:hypothetical protein
MFSVSANADPVVVNNWMVNATGLDANGTASQGVQAGNGVVNNVSFLGFQNTYHTVINGAPAVNTTFNVQSIGLITSFQDINSGSLTPLLFNSVATLAGLNGWEMSFFFDINGKFSVANGDGTFQFDHTSGTLNFYVDSLPSPGGSSSGTQCQSATSQSSCTTAGLGQGVLIASFAVVDDTGNSTYGGVYNPLLGNGGDRSLFTLTNNASNVFRDSAGNPFAVGTTFAVTNSDFQSDVAGSGPFLYNPASFTCGLNPTNFCGTESGQFRIATVPEPGSIALLSAALLGLAGFSRRSKKS